ncbi:helix-turn-helix transcriptional regulator [Paractinoplanes rhizophilus]|uniref:Helix-turn-helix transcriptional regulator n=1 Tax=Paractinoplanes rhizophilus TaxID=1416877 RepID=A0ABW2HQS1_9ACTN|nr:WYL domain-containing protein [Actinoplanes sp.]
MLETSARLLRLLSLLQGRRDWTAAELSERLGVSCRTVRKDVDRLRRLGYPVRARPGVSGGYRLGPGGGLPPLLLDEEEAVAVAVGLRTAASGSVTGIEEVSVRALAKVQQVLPARLRRRVEAISAYALPTPSPDPTVDAAVLTLIAGACRDHERIRFDYRSGTGATTSRDVEPYRLVHDRRRWYLLAWDTTRSAWRSFRADRITPRVPGGPRFTPRPLPSDEAVTALVSRGPWPYRARVVVHAPAQYVRDHMPVRVEVTELGPDRCEFRPGSDHPLSLALYLGLLDADFTVVDGPELVEALGKLAARYSRAI